MLSGWWVRRGAVTWMLALNNRQQQPAGEVYGAAK